MTWAITGTGLVSSLGADTASSFAAFCAGSTSRHPLRAFDASRYRVRHAYELDDRVNGVDTPGRATRWLCAAIGEALAQAGLAAPDRRGGLRIRVLVGTGLAEQRSVELWATGDAEVTLDQLHFARAVAVATGLPHAVTIVNACSASLYALAVGTDLLALDEADVVVAAGTDALSESMFGLLDRVNAEPPDEVRPFDVDRQGVILGEGAAAVVLEPVGQARSREATVLAALRGVGTSCDAYHVTAPLAEGVTRAMRDGHRRAGVEPADVDLVMAHGTGTLLNDRTEAEVLSTVFRGRRPAVTALKSLIGHTSGASGLMSLVTAVRALDIGRTPPTHGHTTAIPEISGFPVVTGEALRAPLRTAQVNAFGFGGVNAVAVLDREPTAGPGASRPSGRGVVVTGVGVQLPGVSSVPELLARVDAGAFVVGDVDFALTLGRRGLRYKDRATMLALCAAARALHAAGFAEPRDGVYGPAGGDLRERFGVVVSTELALVDTVSRVVATIHSGGVPETSPMDLPNASGNVASAHLAIWFRLGGMNLTLSAGATSGIDALYQAAIAIRAGRADRMLVVGVEPATDAAVRLLRDTARRHGDERPLPAVDGAAAVVLEAADVAEGRALADIGRYSRDDASTPPAGWLWARPCHAHGGVPAGTGIEELDLSPTVGEASGALGVFQCAVTALRLAGTGRSGLLTAGGCWGADHASLALRGIP